MTGPRLRKRLRLDSWRSSTEEVFFDAPERQSKFLALPTEIRLMIYDLCLGDTIEHAIKLKPRRWCGFKLPIYDWKSHMFDTQSFPRYDLKYKCPTARLSLALTCRAIHHELLSHILSNQRLTVHGECGSQIEYQDLQHLAQPRYRANLRVLIIRDDAYGYFGGLRGVIKEIPTLVAGLERLELLKFVDSAQSGYYWWHKERDYSGWRNQHPRIFLRSMQDKADSERVRQMWLEQSAKKVLDALAVVQSTKHCRIQFSELIVVCGVKCPDLWFKWTRETVTMQELNLGRFISCPLMVAEATLDLDGTRTAKCKLHDDFVDYAGRVEKGEREWSPVVCYPDWLVET